MARTKVSFVVEPDGRVTCPVMLRSIGSAMNNAVLTMNLRLPRFDRATTTASPWLWWRPCR